MPRTIAALALIALLSTTAGPTQAEPTARDALLGQWIFDAGRSTFDGAMPYRSGRYTFTRTSAGVRVVAEIVEANGQPLRFEYLDREDGKFAPVSGNPFYDSQSTTWGDSRTAVRYRAATGRRSPGPRRSSSLGRQLLYGASESQAAEWASVHVGDLLEPGASCAGGSASGRGVYLYLVNFHRHGTPYDQDERRCRQGPRPRSSQAIQRSTSVVAPKLSHIIADRLR